MHPRWGYSSVMRPLVPSGDTSPTSGMGTNMDTNEAYRILLIQQDAAEAGATRAALAQTKGRTFSVEWARDLSVGVDKLKMGRIDAVLLDLFLSDCQGLAAVEQLRQGAPRVPILIVCDLGDESLAMEAMERGGQDYLLKTHCDSFSLGHALRSMIERAAAAEALCLEKERADAALESIGDAVISTDMAGHITYLNVVAERLTGWARREAAGRPFSEVFHIVDGETRERPTNPMTLAAQENRTVGLKANGALIRRDASETAIEHRADPIHDRRGVVTGAVIVFRDLRLARARALAVSHSAYHDALTDLPNRMLLNDRLDCTIELARRHRRQLAVLFIDVDWFQRINDSLGHEIGDQLLRSVAGQLTMCVRGSDTVSRQGEDEFVILLSEIEQASHAIVSVRKILAAIAEPHHVAGHELHITTSMGVSLYPGDGDDAETLLRNADSAMCHAKDRGRGRYQFFQPDMNLRAVEREPLEGGDRNC
jgi:diguanylate cyclase (GGDEF)-like protein/PAS domain S-box-containing protein